MAGPEILLKVPMDLVQVKEELARIRKRDGDLDIRGNKTEEYAKEFARLSKKAAEDLFESIEKLGVPRLKELHIHKIIDMMPQTVNQLKIVLSGYNVTISQENLKKIVELTATEKK